MNILWHPDLGGGRYRNPVLFADYSDPDAIRVGDDYFFVASSFNNIPGLPVLHSKDLVNWTLINHAIPRLPFDRYDQPLYGNGVWAPAIRFRDGVYYVLVPMPDEGIFETHTSDPWGDWSPLHCVREAKGWIDPCPFWDDDGQAYMVNAFAGSRAGFNSIIAVTRMAPDCSRLLDGEPTYVYDGHATQPTIEGPKLYKRNGWYYIFAPAGGVSTGWQTILRSRNIFGPYEEKIVMRQGNTPVNGPHQGAWVDTPGGEDWFLHFQELQPYGRIVHLQPMRWEEDWPVIGINQNEKGEGEPVLTWQKPNVPEQPAAIPQTSDDFSGGRLGLQWQWNANPQDAWYEMGEKGLILRAACENPSRLWDAPNLLLQKYPAPAFETDVYVDLSGLRDGDEFALAVMAEKYAALCIACKGGAYECVMRDGAGVSRLPRRDAPALPLPEPDAYTGAFPLSSGKCTLKARALWDGVCILSVVPEGEAERLVAVRDIPRAPLFIGARIGVYLMGESGGAAVVEKVVFS